MSIVEVRFTPLAAHVRTARLVALAVARRAGVSEDLLDEVRLAVGEACSRAVGVNSAQSPDTPVLMLLSDDQDRFAVEVVDTGSLDADGQNADLDSLDPSSLAGPADVDTGVNPIPDMLPPGFGLAVIGGLVEDVDITGDARGTRVRMTWPAAAVMAPGTD